MHEHSHSPAHDHAQPGLTPARQRILLALRQEGRPLGAYELIDRVALDTGKRPAPISIYRALDFLLERGLIHRLASRNTYIACGHRHDMRDMVVFLICETCGAVQEATSEILRTGMASLAGQSGFTPHAHVMEVAGQCQACLGATHKEISAS